MSAIRRLRAPQCRSKMQSGEVSVSAAIDYTYRYAFSSGIAATPSGGPQLCLATCDADQQHSHFFDGRARQPRILGEMLYTLSDVVRRHFFLPRPAILDPVLTSNEEML